MDVLDKRRRRYCVVDEGAFLKAINVADVATLCKEPHRLGLTCLKSLRDRGLLVPAEKQKCFRNLTCSSSEKIQECSNCEKARHSPSSTRTVRHHNSSVSSATSEIECSDTRGTKHLPVLKAATSKTAGRVSAQVMGREKRNLGKGVEGSESDSNGDNKIIAAHTDLERTSTEMFSGGRKAKHATAIKSDNLPTRKLRARTAAYSSPHHSHSRTRCPLKRRTHCQISLGNSTLTKMPLVVVKKLADDHIRQLGSNKAGARCKAISNNQFALSSVSAATSDVIRPTVKNKPAQQLNNNLDKVSELTTGQHTGASSESSVGLTSVWSDGMGRQSPLYLAHCDNASSSDERQSFHSSANTVDNVSKRFQRHDRKTWSKKTRRFVILSDDESVCEDVSPKDSTGLMVPKITGLVSDVNIPDGINDEGTPPLRQSPTCTNDLFCGLVEDDLIPEPNIKRNQETENKSDKDKVPLKIEDSPDRAIPWEPEQSTSFFKRGKQPFKLKRAYVRLVRLNMSEFQQKIVKPGVCCRSEPEADTQKNGKQIDVYDIGSTVLKEHERYTINNVAVEGKNKFKRIRLGCEHKTVVRELTGATTSNHKEKQFGKDFKCSGQEKLKIKNEKITGREDTGKSKDLSKNQKRRRTLFDILSSSNNEEKTKCTQPALITASEYPMKPGDISNVLEKTTKLDVIKKDSDPTKQLLVDSLKNAMHKHKTKMEKLEKKHREKDKKKFPHASTKIPAPSSDATPNNADEIEASPNDQLLHSKRKVKVANIGDKVSPVPPVANKAADSARGSSFAKMNATAKKDVSDGVHHETDSKDNSGTKSISTVEMEFERRALSLINKFDCNEENVGISYDSISDEDKDAWADVLMKIGETDHDGHSQLRSVNVTNIQLLKEEVLMCAMRSVLSKLKLLGLKTEDVPKFLNIHDAWQIAREHPQSLMEAEACNGIVKFTVIKPS